MTDLEALGLQPSATTSEVKSAWRQLASLHHPDHNGSAAEFTRLRHCYLRALSQAGKPTVCGLCKGKKRTLIQQGTSILNMVCPGCKGSGLGKI